MQARERRTMWQGTKEDTAVCAGRERRVTPNDVAAERQALRHTHTLSTLKAALLPITHTLIGERRCKHTRTSEHPSHTHTGHRGRDAAACQR